ncbi:NAD-dependent epimerase/dehydratase family protein [Acuticoccus kandeliae]|uniref:NAD-dependent epimerase/dehydratase family protein n=1 Tax=Acuticoccus kandeliae TaxID=2073160 RepID=UPI001300521A|nr:NAD(P)-dependent oxidoreductase [Acuticoccus kandeliae]
MKVFVTGASGFIGSALAAALAADGDTVLATDIGLSPSLAAVLAAHPDSVRFEPGDLSEWAQMARLMKAARPDAVIHCAAIVGIVNSVSAPMATMRVNIEGSLNIMEAMRLFDVPAMVHISSEETYGDFEADVIDETHPCRPLKAYGISKYAVEQLARDYVRTHGLDIRHVRTCWVYGPGLPRPRVPKNLVDAVATGGSCHLANGAEFRVDHTYIADCIDGILRVLKTPGQTHDVYNISTGVAPSLAEIVAILKDIEPAADISVGPGHYAFTPGQPAARKGALDIGRARAALGYAPRYDIARGLAAYVAWRRSNPV